MKESEYERWLIAKVSALAEIDAAKIDINEPFSVYGLSSATGVSITADLEDTFKIKVAPTAIWDYPTIAEMAKFLATQEVQK